MNSFWKTDFEEREKHLIAIAIIEWIETEKQRGKLERTSDIADLISFMERELSDQKVVAEEMARVQLLLKKSK